MDFQGNFLSKYGPFYKNLWSIPAEKKLKKTNILIYCMQEASDHEIRTKKKENRHTLFCGYPETEETASVRQDRNKTCHRRFGVEPAEMGESPNGGT